jgi:hypothetical protein
MKGKLYFLMSGAIIMKKNRPFSNEVFFLLLFLPNKCVTLY